MHGSTLHRPALQNRRMLYNRRAATVHRHTLLQMADVPKGARYKMALRSNKRALTTQAYALLALPR
jgi:hypothetical protein